jgi:hypothetical protein
MGDALFCQFVKPTSSTTTHPIVGSPLDYQSVLTMIPSNDHSPSSSNIASLCHCGLQEEGNIHICLVSTFLGHKKEGMCVFSKNSSSSQ